jgi:hypothetical protein
VTPCRRGRWLRCPSPGQGLSRRPPARSDRCCQGCGAGAGSPSAWCALSGRSRSNHSANRPDVEGIPASSHRTTAPSPAAAVQAATTSTGTGVLRASARTARMRWTINPCTWVLTSARISCEPPAPRMPR